MTQSRKEMAKANVIEKLQSFCLLKYRFHDIMLSASLDTRDITAQKRAERLQDVPVPVISAALFGRFESRGETDYADRLLSALRKQFGGHAEKKD